MWSIYKQKQILYFFEWIYYKKLLWYSTYLQLETEVGTPKTLWRVKEMNEDGHF